MKHERASLCYHENRIATGNGKYRKYSLPHIRPPAAMITQYNLLFRELWRFIVNSEHLKSCIHANIFLLVYMLTFLGHYN